MSKFTVGYFVGSLAKESINRKLANALIKLSPENLSFKEITFGDLPLYSYDHDANFPKVAKDFKNSLASVDAVLFVTPEYNRSIPGALKNAIDWASRPYGQNSFTKKNVRHNRDFTGINRNCRLPAASEKYYEFLQFSDDECHRGLYSVYS